METALEVYETAVELPPPVAQELLNCWSEQPDVLVEAHQLLGLHDACSDNEAVSGSGRFSGKLIGRYEVTRLLGRGSSSEVYAGQDRELGRKVALKFVGDEYAAAIRSAARRFIAEVQAASALNHPNIVTVHEVVIWNSSPVIVMEFVNGKPLRAVCGRSIPLGHAIPIASQLVQALAVAHANGLVHCDLKPENVIRLSARHGRGHQISTGKAVAGCSS